MPTKYAAEAQDALEMITEAGGPIVFLADAYRGGTIAADVTGVGFEVTDDYFARGLIAANEIAVMVAALHLAIIPSDGVAFQWGGRTYSIKRDGRTAPDGDPLIYTIIGAS